MESRSFSDVGPVDVSNKSTATPQKAATPETQDQPGWLSRLLVRNIDTGNEQHSSQLSAKDTVYELQCMFHDICQIVILFTYEGVTITDCHQVIQQVNLLHFLVRFYSCVVLYTFMLWILIEIISQIM